VLKPISDLNMGLRLGMRTYASGVCVISAVGPSGERAAMTASSVTSVSSEPPSLLVCVNRATRMDAIMSAADSFNVNVLAAGQHEVARFCAQPETGERRFEVGEWELDAQAGNYFLKDSLAVFFCRKQQVLGYGTHNIYVADLVEVRCRESQDEPLIYVNGKYLNV